MHLPVQKHHRYFLGVQQREFRVLENIALGNSHLNGRVVAGKLINNLGQRNPRVITEVTSRFSDECYFNSISH